MNLSDDRESTLAELVLLSFPVGVYQVDASDRLVYCNNPFVQIFGYASREELLGSDIRALYADPVDEARFVREIVSNARGDRTHINSHLTVRDRSGRQFVVEVIARALLAADGQYVGRIGTVRDVTAEASLRNLVSELTHDIGRVLHAYTSTLLAVYNSIAPVVSLLEARDSGSSQPLDTVATLDLLNGPVDVLRRALVKVAGESAMPGAPDGGGEEARVLLQALDTCGAISIAEFRLGTIREVAARALVISRNLEFATAFPAECGDLLDAAYEVGRLCAIAALQRAQHTLRAMDYEVRTLREYIVAGMRDKELPAAVSIASILDAAMSDVLPYSQSERVALRLDPRLPQVQVSAIERDVRRALVNILHNAIKYSWRRQKGEAPWVHVRSQVTGTYVEVVVENYGVPISPEELEKVFLIGYRGRFASDRGRPGTGIGLADALAVARAHGGDVVVTSRPASGKLGVTPHADSPYLTAVSLRLPLMQSVEAR